MRKTAFVFVFAFLAVFLFCGYAVSGENYSPFKTVVITDPARTLEQFSDSEIPEFLKRWQRLPKEATFKEQLVQQMEVLNWATSYYKGDVFFVNDAISFTVKVPDRNWEFSMVFSEYKWEDGSINYYHDGQVQKVSFEEFEKIKYIYVQKICESAEHHVNYIGDLRSKVFKNLKKRLVEYKVISEEDNLEKKILELAQFKFQGKDTQFNLSADELMFIPPKFVFGDFCPKKVVITPISFGEKRGIILGVSFPDSGVVLYHPTALILNFLQLSDTFTHELLHRNKYLQGLLVARLMDVETWASFSERMGGGFGYLFHSYQHTSREIGTVITSFDADRARQKIIKFDLGGSYDINEEIADEYGADAEKIFSSFKKTMYGKYIQDFYSDPLFWGCVNDDLYDRNGSYKTYFYTRYAFSLLGGQEKTTKWLNDHEEVIKQAYEKAKGIIEEKRRKDKSDPRSEDSNAKAIERFLLDNKYLIKTYSELLGLPSSASESWKVKQIEMMIRLGVVTLPQVAQPISSRRLLNEEMFR